MVADVFPYPHACLNVHPCGLVSLPPHQVVFREGDSASGIYIILAGMVKVFQKRGRGSSEARLKIVRAQARQEAGMAKDDAERMSRRLSCLSTRRSSVVEQVRAAKRDSPVADVAGKTTSAVMQDLARHYRDFTSQGWQEVGHGG